jgi:glycine cleavage system regulatory protein
MRWVERQLRVEPRTRATAPGPTAASSSGTAVLDPNAGSHRRVDGELQLTLKIRVALFGDAAIPASGAQEGSSVDDLARLLVQLNRSIAGGDDSALLSQVKLLRADSNHRIDRLTEAFDRHSENIAEANSKALVASLSEVIRDFNVKINEQFGDNFKQLNPAVERLVSWQVQYEKQCPGQQ